MIHLDDAAVDAALARAAIASSATLAWQLPLASSSSRPLSAIEAELAQAFVDFAHGRAAMQPRVRTGCEGAMLSTLGAVWPGRGIAGAKIYTTIEGRFTFLVVLFSTRTGALLATLDAGAITRARTAALSALAARRFARADASHLALFGRGVQARAHLAAFATAFPLASVAIVASGDAAAMERDARDLGIADVRIAKARTALEGADLVVTATRSKVPLFEGSWVVPGAFVAAVGSSKPDAREIDDALVARASVIVVEWREQTLREAGDLVLADPVLIARAAVIDIGAALVKADVPRTPGDIALFESVGVGLADVATAGLAFRTLCAE